MVEGPLAGSARHVAGGAHKEDVGGIVYVELHQRRRPDGSIGMEAGYVHAVGVIGRKCIVLAQSIGAVVRRAVKGGPDLPWPEVSTGGNVLHEINLARGRPADRSDIGA